MEPLNTQEMLELALGIVHELGNKGIGCIEGEIILVMAQDRLRSQRYEEMFNGFKSDM
jgi:hypothetical protein